MHKDYSSFGEVFFSLCKAVDTPVSLGAWLRFKYSQTELCLMSIRPESYRNAADFRKDYAVVSFLSKWKGLNTGIDKEAVALQSFESSEIDCKETNSRLRNQATTASPWVGRILHAAQRKIARLIGPFEVSKISPSYGWGPGATSDLPRRRAFLDTKIRELPIPVSRSAKSLLQSEIESDLHWSFVVLGVIPDGQYSLLPGVFSNEDACKITTVPKSAKTDRVIAIEPRGNSFLQKGFGGFLRQRLRRVGIDLNNQGRNQRLASLAYDQFLATIDLKSASDSVSVELVWALLPYEWAASLDAVRSRYAVLPNGERIRLEKFSSMGNGFTFELETLIFWAISSSVLESESIDGDMAVYGDDIIVPQQAAEKVIDALAYIGFRTNKDKTFISGNFYESCGEHFFQGQSVTPCYQKELLDSAIEAVRCGNRLLRMAFRFREENRLAPWVIPAWHCLRRMQIARPSLRWEIPFGEEADDGWLMPYDAFRFGPSSPNRGVRCKVNIIRQVQFVADDASLLAWSYRRGVVTSEPYNGLLEKVDKKTISHLSGFRWVIPTWKFSVKLV